MDQINKGEFGTAQFVTGSIQEGGERPLWIVAKHVEREVAYLFRVGDQLHASDRCIEPSLVFMLLSHQLGAQAASFSLPLLGRPTLEHPLPVDTNTEEDAIETLDLALTSPTNANPVLPLRDQLCVR
ncbi:hypothetical protein [Luteococcus peritonei]|uniref:Uncharacterized protein n=1 Tax=Luteococcus peritonei TaxID=88874 RepID=A0ABW4RW48_9ACTN